MSSYRTLYLTNRTVMGDGKTWARSTEPTMLPELLARTVKVADPAGVTLILADGTHEAAGLPQKLPRGDGKTHPALEAARAAGWRVSGIDPWMTFWQPGTPSVHIGVRPWLRRGKGGNFELGDNETMVEQLRLYQFHKMVGTPYHGANSGLAGIDLLRDQYSGKAPMWTPGNWDRVPPAGTVVETVTDKWRTELPDHGLAYEHSYDARLQFLAAALNAKLALGELRWVHGDQVPLDGPASVLPGYYLVTVPSWSFRDRIPHPLGDRREYGARVWVTGATLELALEVAERDQVMAAPEVHEAWVAVGGQVLKSWAGKIRDAEHLARLSKDKVLHDAVKHVYKAALGLMNRRGQARVFRPDWNQTVVALARCNLWRKMWKEGNSWGRWPVEIHADAVWYAGTTSNPDWPVSFKEGLGLGQFRHEATRAVTR